MCCSWIHTGDIKLCCTRPLLQWRIARKRDRYMIVCWANVHSNYFFWVVGPVLCFLCSKHSSFLDLGIGMLSQCGENATPFLESWNIVIHKAVTHLLMWLQVFHLGHHRVLCDQKMLLHTHGAAEGVILDTHLYFTLAEHPSVTSYELVCETFYEPRHSYFNFHFFFLVFFLIFCRCFPVSAFSGLSLPCSPLIGIFFHPHLPSVRFINQWVVALYGSRDQIRFTSGLNPCSHGLLHLKGNSFNWNFAVQFETRLMLANFTPPFFQNVSSIAHINCWQTKGICHFVMAMSGLHSRNNTIRKGSYPTTVDTPARLLFISVVM